MKGNNMNTTIGTTTTWLINVPTSYGYEIQLFDACSTKNKRQVGIAANKELIGEKTFGRKIEVWKEHTR